MNFIRTKLEGVWLIEPERIADSRGFFARTWCEHEFSMHGLNPKLVQCSFSYNRRRGTIRGLHWQLAPHGEYKLVRCTRGAIFDVVVDVRKSSPTFGQWISYELTENNQVAFYIPEGCAHGFQTLLEDTDVFYQMSENFAPDFSAGIRWNDSSLSIGWPISESITVSHRDQNLKTLEEYR